MICGPTRFEGDCLRHGTYQSFTPGCPTCAANPWPWVVPPAESETSLLRAQVESQAREIERLKGRLARVLDILNDKVDGSALRPAPKIGRGKRFCKRGQVWSRRRAGGGTKP
jgi:hypothetical protein